MTKLLARSSFANTDQELRIKRASKLIKILQSHTDLSHARILDIGTGSGHIAQELAKQAGSVTSIDVWDQRIAKDGYTFIELKEEKLPFENESFDIVISNQVYEHVADQAQHLKEFNRVLKPNGLGYLAVPNRYWIWESHYNIACLSWFPPQVSQCIVKLVRKKDWDVKMPSWKSLQKDLAVYFEVKNAAIDVIKNPDQFGLDTFTAFQPIAKHCPKAILDCLTYVMPSFMTILSKKSVFEVPQQQ